MQEHKSSQLPDHFYIPGDERDLSRFQSKIEGLDKAVREWAASVVNLLPRSLTLLPEEVEILKLCLAQQRRKNLELDAQRETSQRDSGLGRLIALFANQNDYKMNRAVYQFVSDRIQSDINRIFENFCHDHNIPMLDPSYDWRVAIRSMAQELHRIVSSMHDFKNYKSNPIRFELSLSARDHAVVVIGKRRGMLDLVSTSSESV